MIIKQTFFPNLELDESVQNYLTPDTILLDIETTGLSAARHSIYCIGCSYLSTDKDNSITIQLFFAEKPEQEAELLTALAALLQTHKKIITFNGSAFDLPFLKKRYASNHMKHSFSDILSIDLYREACRLKELIRLPDYKQKSIECFLGYFREDSYSGKELIAQYLLYIKEPAKELLHNLLLHNEEDVHGMYRLLPLLFYSDFLNGNFRIESVCISSTDQTHYCDITLNTTYSFPQKITSILPEASLLFCDKKVMISFPVHHGSLRHYFKDYKNYYYLPEEQTIIHKSLGSCVDSEYRKKVTKENCYLEKACDYLIHFVPDKNGYLRSDYSDTATYFELPQTDPVSGKPLSFSSTQLQQLYSFLSSFLKKLLH